MPLGPRDSWSLPLHNSTGHLVFDEGEEEEEGGGERLASTGALVGTSIVVNRDFEVLCVLVFE